MKPSQARTASGFSLVELILALGLGLVVTAGVVQLFVGNNQTYTQLMGQSRLQESARFAMDFISRSARAAGYFGCDPDTDRIYNTLNSPWSDLFEADLTRPIQAFNYTGDGAGTGIHDWSPGLARLPRMTASRTSINTMVDGTGVDLATLVPATDIVVFRRLETPTTPIAVMTDSSANPVLVAGRGGGRFQEDDLALISNCEQAALFRVTAVGPGPSAPGGVPTVGLRRDAGKGPFANAPGSALSGVGVAFGSSVDSQGAAVGRVITDIYFIAAGAGQNNLGQPTRSLWRRSGTGKPRELVEGVWDLQVRFAVDNTPGDASRASNRYLEFADIGADDVIRALRIELTTSTINVLSGNLPTTRTFVQTISLRNS